MCLAQTTTTIYSPTLMRTPFTWNVEIVERMNHRLMIPVLIDCNSNNAELKMQSLKFQLSKMHSKELFHIRFIFTTERLHFLDLNHKYMALRSHRLCTSFRYTLLLCVCVCVCVRSPNDSENKKTILPAERVRWVHIVFILYSHEKFIYINVHLSVRDINSLDLNNKSSINLQMNSVDEMTQSFSRIFIMRCECECVCVCVQAQGKESTSHHLRTAIYTYAQIKKVQSIFMWCDDCVWCHTHKMVKIEI